MKKCSAEVNTPFSNRMKKPLYSVIVPAYNEEFWLPKSLCALKDAMEIVDLPGEIIVCDNNSTDKTAELAKAYGARLVFEPKNQISRARNAGAGIANGTYLIFMDADSLISAKLLKRALNNLQGHGCCGGGTLISFDDPTGPFASQILRFWTGISLRYQLAAGSFIYCLREAFEEIGGFSEYVYAGEEIFFSQRLKKWGKMRELSFCLIPDSPIITSARKLKQPISMVLATLICIFFPFFIYFKRLCWYWYKRPSY